jgi:uncharacterized protein (TIGR02147 family)
MSLFQSDDYKEIIKLQLRQSGRKTSGAYRKLADHLNVHATLISQVLAGTKDFSEEQLWNVCEYLGMTKVESNYLLCLLHIEKAGSQKLKDHYREQKIALQKEALSLSRRVPKERTLAEDEMAIFYSSWIYSAIHLYTTLDQEIYFDDICKRFNIPPRKAREILDFLKNLEMVGEKNGRYRAGQIFTHLEKNSPFVLKHHTNWRLKAIQAAENLSEEELLYSVNASLSRQDFLLLREEMIQFVQRFLKTVKDSPAEEIAQFNLDFFWIKS